jgi:uncharacterized membrane protein (UPF0127 family)
MTMNREKKSGKKVLVMVVIIFAITLIIGLIFKPYFVPKKPEPIIKKESITSSEPQFRKDGDLIFYTNTKQQKHISIEIVSSESDRNRGLMYRKSMSDSCGMLFVFEQMQPLSFWMKNTHIPLDIIFVDDKFAIVSISKNTTPFSEESLPSAGPSMYVVEVNAGFCDNNHIVPGNKISFTTLK